MGMDSRMRVTRVATLLLAVVSSLTAWAQKPSPEKLRHCGDLAGARALYRVGDLKGALSSLDCMIVQEPKDFEARRLRSDILWWEEREPEAEAEALAALVEGPADLSSEIAYPLHDRTARFRISGSIAGLWAPHDQSGTELDLAASYRYLGKSRIVAGYLQKSRVFGDGTALSDTTLYLAHVSSLSRRVYLEERISGSPSPIFSARWAFGIEPHFLIGDETDLSVGAAYSSYPEIAIPSITLGATRTLGESWLVGARLFEVFANRALSSAAAFGEHALGPVFSFRLTLAGGTAYEGLGVENGFLSASGVLRARISRSTAFHLDATIYQGDVRSEKRLGGGLEWTF